MLSKIVTAYAYSPKFGYQARALVHESQCEGLPPGNAFVHTIRTGLGDSKHEAIESALAYVLADLARDCPGVPVPTIEARGRVLTDWLDCPNVWAFN